MHTSTKQIVGLFLAALIILCMMPQVSARYYDPKTGRFTQPDTVIPNPYNPQDLNRYAYVRNNPMKYVDPSGHILKEADMGTVDDAQNMLTAIRSYYADNYQRDLSEKELLRIAVDVYGTNYVNDVSDTELDSSLRPYILSATNRKTLPRGITTKSFGDIDLSHAYAGYLQTERTGIPGTSVASGYGYEIFQGLRGSYGSVFSVEDQPSMLFGDMMYVSGQSRPFGHSITPEQRLASTYSFLGASEPSKGYGGDVLPGDIPATINPLPVPYSMPNPLYYVKKYGS